MRWKDQAWVTARNKVVKLNTLTAVADNPPNAKVGIVESATPFMRGGAKLLVSYRQGRKWAQ